MSQVEGGPFDFTALLAPIAVEHFFRAHWERHPRTCLVSMERMTRFNTEASWPFWTVKVRVS